MSSLKAGPFAPTCFYFWTWCWHLYLHPSTVCIKKSRMHEPAIWTFQSTRKWKQILLKNQINNVKKHTHTHRLGVYCCCCAGCEPKWRSATHQRQHFSEQVNTEPQTIPGGNERQASNKEGSELYSSRKPEHTNLSDGNVSPPRGPRQESHVEEESNLS